MPSDQQGGEYMAQDNDMMQKWMAHFQRDKQQKLQNFREMNQYALKGQILFTGSSLMEQFPIVEYCMNAGITPVYNRGIGGYTTDEFLEGIHEMLLDLEPRKVFINIGTNDIRNREDGEDWLTHLIRNYRSILTALKTQLPQTQCYLMAYYPVNPDTPQGRENQALIVRTNANVDKANQAVRQLAEEMGYTYIDCNDGLKDVQGRLKAAYAKDGMHIFAQGYATVFDRLRPYL